MVPEEKLDDSFPVGQFLIDGFQQPFRFDRNKNGGGILLYVHEDILAKLISNDHPAIESFYVELTLHKKKCLKTVLLTRICRAFLNIWTLLVSR